MQVLKGAYDAFLGKELDLTIPENTQAKPQTETAQKEEREIRFGYCTEFIILLNKTFNIKQEIDFKAYLESIGDSIVVVADDDVVAPDVTAISGYRSYVYAIVNNDTIVNIKDDQIVSKISKMEYTEEDLKTKFGALYNAFQFGAPPHAGMAPGVDRMIMLLRNEENIREIIPFPMNGNAQDLMCGAPGEVTEQQLREVHIKVRQ